MSCIVDRCNQSNYHYNPLICPLLNFHETIATIGSQLPKEGKAGEVAQRIGLAVLSPFIYLALAFVALAGLILNGIWEKKHISDLTKKNQDGTAQLVQLFGPQKNLQASSQIPEGAFGKAEWEKTFPVTIEEVPPLPANIHAILELEDPWEPGKRLKETCMLFMRPQKVILHKEGGDKEFLLGFDGVEQLAMNATNEKLRTEYFRMIGLNQMNQTVAAGWVLMRKEGMPGSRNKSYTDQQSLLKEGFEVPKMLDAILLNILTYASEGKCLYGSSPLTYTRCQERFDEYQTVVGGFDPSQDGLQIDCDNYFDEENIVLAGSWKF